MRILVTGGTGFVGRALIRELIRLNHSITVLTRQPQAVTQLYGDIVTSISWDACSGPPPASAYEDVDVIINLLGENIARKRWTDAQKKAIYDSRIVGTRHLIEGAQAHASSVSTIISTSAVGYYDQDPSQQVTESDPHASSFLGSLCHDWERAVLDLTEPTAIRCVIFRVGVVIGDGGAINQMIGPFLWGLGGQLGNGEQWMNWIDLSDLVRLYVAGITDSSLSGVYNAVSPNNVTNRQFTSALGQRLNRMTRLSVPAIVLRIILGELSELLLLGSKVQPKRLLDHGFSFSFPTIADSLTQALHFRYIPHLKKTIRCQRLMTSQFLPYSQSTVFQFFSDASNLERLTPPHVQFAITWQSTPTIQANTLFDYRLRIRGIPIFWRTLITDWEPQSSFTDTQLNGPYQVWHHTHRFYPYSTGTWIEDEIFYAPPNIPIIKWLLLPFIKRDIHSIFQFRQRTIHQCLSEAS